MSGYRLVGKDSEQRPSAPDFEIVSDSPPPTPSKIKRGIGK